MKKITGFLLTILLLSCFSCKKFITEKPYSFLSPANYFEDGNDAYAALLGVYSGLGENSYYSRFMFLVPTLISDESVTITGDAASKQMDALSYSSTLSSFLTLWRAIYVDIMRANVVIGRVPGVPMDEALKKQYIAEAKFLRALNYFNLVRFWGEVPLVKDEVEKLEDAYVGRASVKDVYDFIIQDLEDAKAVLPDKNPDGRAGKGSVTALLAKVYLTRASSEAAQEGDYKKCADLCKEVIGMSAFHLMDDFQQAIGANHEFNPESLFEWNGDREIGGSFTSAAQFALPSGVYGLVPENATGESWFGGDRDFYNSISDQDYRKASTFITSGKDIDGNDLYYTSWPFPYPSPARKFINPESTTRSGYAFGTNYVVLRLADVYLMRAEALNEIGGPGTEDAYAMINAIRARARHGNGSSVSDYPADLSGLSQASFRDSVLEERKVELAYEGHRFFDLIRTKRLLSVLPKAKEKHYLLPIPNTEILLSKGKLTQNTGW
ncbi:RagB/SusD family nutrient uptake outer membrane protein [Compostibacter hankyongensis]|uniref:RagB/SusD family nutrient uptake outer membrane protein n=1 Tax=Compostibacter hankyongensis TaxID=1007089 RepID=A0ABP8G5K4_9BACT